ARRLELILRQSVLYQLLQLEQCDAKGHVGVGGNNRPDPHLENLALPDGVGIRKELKHAAWERFDIRVIAVIEPATGPEALIQAARRNPMLANPRPRDRQRGEVGVAARDGDRKAERYGGRARVLFEDLYFTAGRHPRVSLDARRRLPLRQS